MSALPASINVGGKRIRIRVVASLECWGEYDHDEAEIRLSPKALAKRTTLIDTLRHEVLEAALHISGIAWSEKYDQEPIVRAIESIFFPAYDKLTSKLAAFQPPKT